MTASLTAVLMSASSSTVGSSWEKKAAAAEREKLSLAERLKNTRVISFKGFCIGEIPPFV